MPQLARHAYQAAESRSHGPGSMPQQPAAFAAMQGGAAPPAGVVQIQLLGGGRAAAKTAFNQDFIDLLKRAAVSQFTGPLSVPGSDTPHHICELLGRTAFCVDPAATIAAREPDAGHCRRRAGSSSGGPTSESGSFPRPRRWR